MRDVSPRLRRRFDVVVPQDTEPRLRARRRRGAFVFSARVRPEAPGSRRRPVTRGAQSVAARPRPRRARVAATPRPRRARLAATPPRLRRARVAAMPRPRRVGSSEDESRRRRGEKYSAPRAARPRFAQVGYQESLEALRRRRRHGVLRHVQPAPLAPRLQPLRLDDPPSHSHYQVRTTTISMT